MWTIISCDLIRASVCVVDTMIFERYVASDKNKHDVCCAELDRQGRFLLSQK